MYSGKDWDSSREGVEVGISITGMVCSTKICMYRIWSSIVLILSLELLIFTSHVSGPINLTGISSSL